MARGGGHRCSDIAFAVHVAANAMSAGAWAAGAWAAEATLQLDASFGAAVRRRLPQAGVVPTLFQSAETYSERAESSWNAASCSDRRRSG